MQEWDLNSVLDRLVAADSSWLTTVRPDGRPHSAPVWHVWNGGRFYVVTQPKAVKAANIRRNQAVVLSHPDPHAVIIVDGRAQFVEGLTRELQPLFQEKYAWDIAADKDYTAVIAIEPLKVLAWPEEGAGHRRRWQGSDLAGL